MSSIDIGVILIFTLIVFACGLSFSKSGSNMKSFFAAGGAVPWWISGLSLFMSFFSAGTFVVWGSIAYSHGWVAITIQWTMAIAGFIIGFWLAPKWRKTGVITAAEFITKRLGYNVQKFYTIIFLVISLFTTGAFLYPVAKIVEVSSGIPIELSILVLGILIITYTAVGGLWAVLVTDVLQFVVLTAAVLIVVPLSFDKVGGVDGFLMRAPEGFFNLLSGEYTVGFLFAFGLYNLFFIAGNWAYVQRYTSVPSHKDAKKVGWLFGSLYAISPLIWMIPPMLYRIVNPELSGQADEGAYLMMCKEVLPLGMIGLILGGMVFATSSSVNTTLNISAGVFSNDIFRHFRPNYPTEKLVKVGRYATVGFGLITIVVALLVPLLGGIVEFVLTLAALTGGALYLPPLWALFSKRQTGISIISITIISLLINVAFKFIIPLAWGISLSRAMEMMVGVMVPIVLLAAYDIWAVLSNRESRDYMRYTALKKDAAINPEHQDDEEESVDNTHGVRVITVGVMITGLLITTIGFIAPFAKEFVGGVGILVFMLGFVIFYRTLKNKNIIDYAKRIICSGKTSM